MGHHKKVLVGKIYWDEVMGEGNIEWTLNFDEIQCKPTSQIDLRTDILAEIENKFEPILEEVKNGF